MTLKQAAKNALQVQDACNSRGIARSMVEAMDAIANDNSATGHVNTHPIVFLFLYKLSALNGHERLDEYQRYETATAECERIASDVAA